MLSIDGIDGAITSNSPTFKLYVCFDLKHLFEDVKIFMYAAQPTKKII